VVVSAATTGARSASRTCSPTRACRPRSWTSRRRPGRERGGRTDRRGLRGAELKLAILAESDVTGRRVATGWRGRGPGRPTLLRRPRPGATWCTAARCGALCRGDHPGDRGTTRDYLVLEYRGSDRLYLPVDQIEAVTPYSAASRRPSPRWRCRLATDRAKARPPRRGGRGAVQLYRRRLEVEGHAFAPDTPWQRELEVPPLHRDRRPAPGHRGRESRHGAGAPDGPPRRRRRRVRQDRGGHPGGLQGGAGRQAGGGARAHHPARQPAPPDVR